MFDWLMWFTRMENTKPLVLVVFSITFVLILLYVFTGKKRSERFESYKDMPLDDEDLDAEHRKELNHEHRED